MGTTVLLPYAMTLPSAPARGHGLVIEDGVIREVVEHAPAGVRTLPIEGTLLPGFIDLQVNGLAGASVQEGDDDALDEIARAVWQGGAVAFLPTLITAPFEQLLEQLRRVSIWIRSRRAAAQPDSAVALGVHVEGPFLENPGAHDPDLFVDPTPERIQALLTAAGGELRLLTLAHSRPGAAEAVRQLTSAGTAVSLGHALATEGFRDCVAAGAVLITHLFNAMGPLHHREPTMAGLALDTPEVGCSLIADGIHVHPSMVRNAFRCLGADRLILVSDATAAAGMPDGEYRLAAAPVRLADGAVRDQRGRLAGSALTMAAAARTFLEMVPAAGPSTIAAVAAANPARYLGLRGWGSLEPGGFARFTLLGTDGSMRAIRY